ncbi:MAG: hypothetical protein ACTS5V_11060, partial [Giesbergeria sp.]
MNPQKNPETPARRWFRTGWVASVASLIAACRSTPPAVPSMPEADGPTTSLPQRDDAVHPSAASNVSAYRHDAATHLYAKNAQRIYQGRLPPLLYAIGVLRVDIDAKGRVVRTSWTRAPSHAPEVMLEI